MTYDPSLVTYEELLDTFWASIDPTQKDGQGGDRGTQYRTGVYTHSEEQRLAALASKEKLQHNIGEAQGRQVLLPCTINSLHLNSVPFHSMQHPGEGCNRVE